MSLFEETPYVQVISPEYWGGKCCFSCFLPLEKPRKCSRCSQAWYCSQSCQSTDWSTAQHKNECRVLRAAADSEQKLDDVIADRSLRGIARVISRKVSEKVNPVSNLHVGWPKDMKCRHISDLCSHLEFRMNDVDVCHDIKPAWEAFQKYYVPHVKLYQYITHEHFEHYAGLWSVNNMAVEKVSKCEDFEVLGAGLYLQASRFDHTCGNPDLVRYFQGSKICLKPTNPSQKIDSSNIDELRIHYISNTSLMSTANRQQHLMSNYLFVCQCETCKDETSDLIKGGALKEECQKCQSPYVFWSNLGKMGSFLTMATLKEFETGINSDQIGNYYCPRCKNPGPEISAEHLKSLIEAYQSLRAEALKFSMENWSEILQTVVSGAEFLHCAKNAALVFACLKLLEHWKLYVGKAVFEQFSTVARWVLSRFEETDSNEWLLGISRTRFAQFLECSGRKEEAKLEAKIAKAFWVKVTCENYEACGEIDELIVRCNEK